MRRARNLVATLSAGALVVALAGCGAGAGAGELAAGRYDWKGAPDVSKIAAQGVGLPTYGISKSWAGYGEVIKAFCAGHRATCEHTDTRMSAGQQIERFDAEQDVPVAGAGDIGLTWGPIAEAKGVVPDYLPPSASRLKDWQRAKNGGWVATFAGSIAFVVNTKYVKHVPKSWADLLKPEYKGMVAFRDPREWGTGQYMLIAAAIAGGGGIDDPAPGYDFFARLWRSGNVSTADMTATTFEDGEAPIQIDYDFNGIAQRKKLKKRDIAVKVVIPSDGSVWGPSALMINKYDVAKADLLKSLLDYVLGDEAQIRFAESGARPIRYMNGDLSLPKSARKSWLPASSYARVREIDVTKIDVERIGRDWELKVLARSTPPPTTAPAK
jgi:putative spermidine/putrescine transport system substrate-binding protein